ncbi:class I SAM-dependent methyltransferase [Reyranella sp.]|uniref:class I SAM-dependent methyltransferase n=1 Tax=Reyranella sp. TaxID=1929291 RepID=UPI003BA9876D
MTQADPTSPLSERLATVERTLRWRPRRREIVETLRALIATVDADRLERLRREHEAASGQASAVAGYKYLDVAFYTLQKLMVARALGLHEGPRRRILDIGTGGGHFPFVCRFLGHEVVALDIDNPVYQGIADCLGVERTVFRVEPGRKLPAPAARFDLVVAHDVTFNDRPDEGGRRVYWSLEEWRFFLNDLVANQLRYPGTIDLKLNPEFGRDASGAEILAHNRLLLDLAARHGAAVDRRRGTIRLALAGARTFPQA